MVCVCKCWKFDRYLYKTTTILVQLSTEITKNRIRMRHTLLIEFHSETNLNWIIYHYLNWLVKEDTFASSHTASDIIFSSNPIKQWDEIPKRIITEINPSPPFWNSSPNHNQLGYRYLSFIITYYRLSEFHAVRHIVRIFLMVRDSRWTSSTSHTQTKPHTQTSRTDMHITSRCI